MQIYHLGQLKTAQKQLEQALTWGKTIDGMHQAFTGTSHILMGAIFLEWNRLDEAAKHLNQGIELVQQSGIGYSLTFAHCMQARLLVAQNEMDGASEALRLANQAAEATPLTHILLHNLAYQIKLTLRLGDVESASRWIEKGADVPGDLPPYLCEIQQISAAWVYLAQGDLEKAIITTDGILSQAEAAGRNAHVIESYLIQVRIFQEKKKTAQSIEVLKKAISFSASEGYIRIFVEGGKPVWELLRLIADQNFNRQYVNQLLAAFNEKATKSKVMGTTNLNQSLQNVLVEPLTDRECEVLKLIAAGYTNQQIADALVVSLNTVKKHTTHIYGKLGVQNRTEASNRARELGLV
jgi:LuxR family maltose regulon positive regulatory protein